MEHGGHALVLGGPGSGKTAVALGKAVCRIGQGLRPGQTIMFLSFSRAAVARLAEAAKSSIPGEQGRLLSLQTFHSFCWELLKGHSYLLGAPKRLSILLPQDEKALSGFKKPKPENPAWQEWLAERERLFFEEGRVAFDLFARSASALLERSAHLRRLVSQRHPLIVVDEAQDTGPEAWRCIELLAPHSQVLCLADMEQQIFDHLPGVGPERIAAIRAALSPLEIDLGSRNHRSPGTEIAVFGNDILTLKPRGAPYKGVSKFVYPPKNPDWGRIVRVVLSVLHRQVKKQAGAWARSVAVLAPSGGSAAKISAALGAGEKPVRHRLHFDESEAMLSARFAAFLLEPRNPDNVSTDVATALDLLADVKKAAGLAKAKERQVWAASLRSGKTLRAGLVKSLFSLLARLNGLSFSGSPGKDWLEVKQALRDSGQDELREVARHLDYLVAFNRGKRISANLAAEWSRDGRYTYARSALDSALAQDQLLDGADAPEGLQIMTIHKSKGKQFDAVIVLREGRYDQESGRFVSSFVWWGDNHPHTRSRKILRVAVTRAKVHTLILEPAFPACPILGGHDL
ncbi:MAG: ATP-dependent helicase [Vicinamibacteria bacterium]|nr:ATP-dependent helicase [Vicinamibacteria bacterium]